MDHGELREPTFLILVAIAVEPCHGYGIKQTVDQMSQGRFQLAPGTLYSALERLVVAGLAVETGRDVVMGRTRRYYVLTDQGEQVLDAEVTRLRTNALHGAEQLDLRRRA